jgi:hypothetical protein
VKIVSLFSIEKNHSLHSYIEDKKNKSKAISNADYLFLSSSIDEITHLFGSKDQYIYRSRKSPFSEMRSYLREFSISGYESEEQASTILDLVTRKQK